MNYTLIPYNFGRLGETVRAVIRSYNSLDISDETLTALTNIFNEVNAEHLPPKLGRTLMIPVLDEYIDRHKDKLKNQ